MIMTRQHSRSRRLDFPLVVVCFSLAVLVQQATGLSTPYPSAILQQIQRAKQQLDSFQPKSPNDNAHVTDIKAALDDGRVKPFFHTLFLPEPFLNNHRSFSKVTAGGVDQERTMDLGIRGIKLNEVVNATTSRGARFIIDNGMEGTWEFDSEQAAFAVELVNTEAEMLGEGIECTEIPSFPIKITPGEDSYDLLTRPESRGVVRDIFCRFVEKPKGGSVAAITGLPGIGKSWTLLYALQQALHYDGANVLFFFQKTNNALMYLRRNDKIFAWSTKTKGEADSSLFMRPDVLVLLDPREARQGGADFALGDMKLLYAASNNLAHFRGAAEKEYGQIQTFLGPPLDNELPVILQRLNPLLEPEIIEERTTNVGNLIRYILDEEKYKARNDAIDEAVTRCAADDTLLELALGVSGMSNGQLTIPGTLFQIFPKRPEVPTITGYDGQEVDYRERMVEAANENVRDQLLNAKRKPFLTYMGKVTSDEFARMGRKMEDLFIDDLKNDKGMVVKTYLQGSGAKKKGKEGKLIIKSRDDGIEYLTEGFKDMSDVCASVLNKDNVVARSPERFELFDAAGPGRKVYQCTVSPGHRLSVKSMENLARELGYIGPDDVVVDVAKKLEFYWVVPPDLASSLKTKAPYSFRENNDKKRNKSVKILKVFMARHVDQYILPMTFKTPITAADHEEGIKPL